MIVGCVRPMRRLFTVTLGVLVGVLAFVPAAVVAPAAQAGEIEQLSISADSCGSGPVILKAGNLVADRDTSGSRQEDFVFTFHDGARPLDASLIFGTSVGRSGSYTYSFQQLWGATVNPITVTAVSPAGNGYEELFLDSAELYCADLPGAIVTTPAHFTYPDAADVSGTLVPFVEELAGSPVTYSVGTPPASGALAVNPDGTFTYQWGRPVLSPLTSPCATLQGRSRCSR